MNKNKINIKKLCFSKKSSKGQTLLISAFPLISTLHYFILPTSKQCFLQGRRLIKFIAKLLRALMKAMKLIFNGKISAEYDFKYVLNTEKPLSDWRTFEGSKP